MGDKKFSVAMSVYKNDDADYFARALKSILDDQTIKPSEVVLVMDGPVSKEIEAVANSYSKKYTFKIIRLEQNVGLGNALKVATNNCAFDLIARMDSDDVAVENRFEQQLLFFENNDVDILGGNISEFENDENNIVSYRNVPSSHSEIIKYIKKRCPFNHMTVMFKKHAIEKAGGYLDLHYNEDYYLWVRMLKANCKFANIPSVLVNVRTGKGQFSRRGGYKYFKSEKFVQKYMLKNKIISPFTYFMNTMKRFVVQVLFPSSLRGFVLRKFARKKVKESNN